MKLEELLAVRSGNTCELCKDESALLYQPLPAKNMDENGCIMACTKCIAQIEKKEEADSMHWQCLKEIMWSDVPAIQVIVWRMLNRFRNESWAAENLDMLYLDDETLAWAKALGDDETDASVNLHKDCNGQQLKTGDAIVLIKSLDVKGSNLNAKMGTVVKNIRLVEENTEQIEGKIEGQVIVILTKYVRKQN